MHAIQQLMISDRDQKKLKKEKKRLIAAIFVRLAEGSRKALLVFFGRRRPAPGLGGTL